MKHPVYFIYPGTETGAALPIASMVSSYLLRMSTDPCSISFLMGLPSDGHNIKRLTRELTPKNSGRVKSQAKVSNSICMSTSTSYRMVYSLLDGQTRIAVLPFLVKAYLTTRPVFPRLLLMGSGCV